MGAARAAGVPSADQQTPDREPALLRVVDGWADSDWWQALIDAAVSGADPVLGNLRITLAHQELSLALHQITGAASGANFHTWAVWGSKKAGRTIREEDLPAVKHACWALATLLGVGTGFAVAPGRASARTQSSIAAGTALAALLYAATRVLAGRARREIFDGNVTVLTDIGRQTGRFVSTFLRPEDRTEEQLEEFCAELRPGHVVHGGQDLLRGAYRHYFAAAAERDPHRRDECMLYANLLAILHEHHRLDPYIHASVPRPARRFVTKHMLGFAIGVHPLKVSDDVPRVGSLRWPDTLETIDTPELVEFLFGVDGWDRNPGTLTGSAAGDWTELSDRMNFIVDLFRSRHADPDLFTAPYSQQQRAMIVAGRVPGGPL